jgi:hypothetical protein
MLGGKDNYIREDFLRGDEIKENFAALLRVILNLGGKDNYIREDFLRG